MSILVLPGELARRVARGTKTVHRIKAQRGRVKPELDESLPVQVRTQDRHGRSKVKTICRVHVLDVKTGDLRDVTDDEIRDEGHVSRGEYFRWWRETIERVEPPASDAEPFAPVGVWVVRFQVDQRRFLAARPGTTDQMPESAAAHGYTSNPGAGLVGEGEIVYDTRGLGWNEKLELERKQAWARERVVIAQSIERLEADASLRAEVRVLKRQLAAIDRKLFGVAA